MDTSGTPQPLPRLRVSRPSPSRRSESHNSSAALSSQAGPSRLPDLTQLVDLNLTDIRASYDSTDEEQDQDQYPTPRMNASSLAPGESMAERLRALIHLVPNGSGSQSTPRPHRPPSPTFLESDFEGKSSFAPAPSFARESLRDIFMKARRDPGDTPEKGRQRRNSDTSAREVDSDFTSSKTWADVKGKRKSLSDDDSESPEKSRSRDYHLNGSSQRTVRKSSPQQTSAVAFPLKPISADDSDLDDSPKTTTRLNTTSAPLQSLRISQSSSIPQHSNLLEQDSEMQRAFDYADTLEYPSVSSHNFRKSSVPQVASGGASSATPPHTPKKMNVAERSHIPRSTRKSLDLFSPSQRPAVPSQASSHLAEDAKGRHDINQSDERRRVSSHGSIIPQPKHRSRVSSMTSIDSERGKENDQHNNAHLKPITPSRNLHSPKTNYRTRTPSVSSQDSPRSGSALSNASMDSGDRTRTRTISGRSDRSRTLSHLGIGRPSSAMSDASIPDFPHGLRRHHSLTSRADSQSPASSKDSGSQSGEAEEVLERERNWNAPRPKWHRRSLPNTPERPASPGASNSSYSPSDTHRRTDLASKDAANNSRLDSKSSPYGEYPMKSKPVPLSPSPANRRLNSAFVNGRSPRSLRTTSMITSTPARPRSPLPRFTPQNKVLLSSPSNRNSKAETPKHVPKIRDHGANIQPPQEQRDSNTRSQVSMDLTEAWNIPEASSALPSFSQTIDNLPNDDTMHTASLLGPISPDVDNAELSEVDDESMAQERTPTMHTIKPPPEDDELANMSEEEVIAQVTVHSEEEITVGVANSTEEEITAGEAILYEEDIDAEGNTPPFEQSADYISAESRSMEENRSSVPSFLSTPPRSRLYSLNQEFATPPPPKDLPDLPDSPTSFSDDEIQSDSIPKFDITPAQQIVPSKADYTAIQTPRPPGGWLATPAPTSRKPMHGDSTDDSGLEMQAGRSTFMQTPAVPGGWKKTPVARNKQWHPQEEPSSVLNEGGLTTPVSSIGRNNRIPSKIPLSPGNWENTPGGRKSILKVRFQPKESSQVDEFSDVLPNNIGSQQRTKGATAGSGPSSPKKRTITPEPATTPSSSRSPQKYRKSPGIRIVDEYGNVLTGDRVPKRESPSPTPALPENNGGDDNVDALGQEAKEEPSNEAVEQTEGVSIEPPKTRAEALQRVRQGILELAEGIESLDLTNQTPSADQERIKALNDASRASRLSRRRLAKDVRSADAELRRQMDHKGKNTLWSTKISKNYWLLFFLVGVAQVVLIFVMYRSSVLRARALFMTTYNDPFNPDLFLYTINPDTHYATSKPTWKLVVQAARNCDLATFTATFRENLSILIKGWHQQLWDVWGDDPSLIAGTWPPN